MIRNKHIICVLACLLGVGLLSCTKESNFSKDRSDNETSAIQAGDEVLLGSCVCGIEGTKALVRDDELISHYPASSVARSFTVEMYQKVGDVDTKVGDSFIYDTDPALPSDGLLKPKDKSMLWPDTQIQYAFKATSGNEVISSDQTTLDKFVLQDRLVGYGYEALKDDATGNPVDNIDALNYRTSKEWYSANKTSYGAGGSSANWKVIPLFLKRQHSRITIILKAGKGITRESLDFLGQGALIKNTIYSYNASGVQQEINPLASQEFIHYDKDDTGEAADSVSTTRFDAIVEPFNYLANPEFVMTKINLSDQKFSYYTRNDSRYSDPSKAAEMECYNIKAGQQLVLLVKLEAGNHIIVLSAQIQDWSDVVHSTVTDDFGQNGNPFIIYDKADLVDFLTDTEKNKSGNLAVIAATEIDLDSGSVWDPTLYTLKGSINMAGAELQASTQFLNEIASGASLQNGTINIKAGSTVASACCKTNNGTIESISVATDKTTPGKATVAGIAEENHEFICNCTSALPVYGTSGNVGGIAATSSNLSTSYARIEGCTVNSCVKGATGCVLGGIVGQAEGIVSGNNFNYGITLSQDASSKNIVAASSGSLTASSNSWKTTSLNDLAGTNVCPDPYDGVIDSQEDLKVSLDAGYNLSDKKYGIQNSFTVTDSWSGSYTNVHYSLNGNSHTIVLTGSTNAVRLFNGIENDMQDIIIDVQKTIVDPDETLGNSTATAALGYSVFNGATLSNIRVKTASGAYIEASNPGGIVVWAYGHATLTGCQFKGNLRIRLYTDMGDGKCYAGGIVSMSEEATFMKCVCHTEAPFSRAADGYSDPGHNIYYGGILGGTYNRSETASAPNTLIADCTSNFIVSETARVQNGSIASYAKYDDSGVYLNGLNGDCQGNWWPEGSVAISTQGLADGVTEKQAIGKCNAIKPTLDSEW